MTREQRRAGGAIRQWHRENDLGRTSLQIICHLHDHPERNSIRDLMTVTGLMSPNAVKCHIIRLEKLGLVHNEFGLARTLRLTCTLEAMS